MASCYPLLILQLFWSLNNGNQRLHWVSILMILGWLGAAVIIFILEMTGYIAGNRHLNTAMFGGYVKDALTLFKYIPQIYRNYIRKSTKGFNIWAVNTDLAGGFFSYLQLLIDSMIDRNANVLNGGFNIGKFGLSVISIVFCLIFAIQHYWLYREDIQIGDKPGTKIEDYMSNSNQPLSMKCDKEY